MLQSVIGIIDSRGLNSLRLEDDTGFQTIRDPGRRSVPIWAVLDSRDLREVRQAVTAMQPSRALRLLNERAVSLGRIAS